MKTLLTAVKPTGELHLGNYAGAIRPALEALGAPGVRGVVFVADAHALNSVSDPARLVRHGVEVATGYLACGLDSERALFFRQSDVPEIFELAAILACVCPKGLVNRGHAYKAAVGANQAAGRDPDAGINMGLFGYPILMAADILCFDADVVPIGADQRQHVEIARVLARRLNQTYGEGTAVIPDLQVQAESAEVPGTDDRKMSKSRGNHIPLAASREELRARIFSFVTDGRRPGEPADPEAVPLFALAKALGTADEARAVAAALREGAGYAAVKEQVFESVDRAVSPIRRRYAELRDAPDVIDQALAAGAERARDLASGVLARIKKAVGLS
jgi:tryptophanyl-tRNA synthetase